MIATSTFCLATAAGVLIYVYRKMKMNLFKKIKIDGPEPNAIFGNLSQLENQVLFETRKKWTREFGKVYGYYEGTTPVIVVSDLDVLKEVFVTQFQKFCNRPTFPLQPNPSQDKPIHLFFARDGRWLKLRSICNPIFRPHQLRKTFPLLKEPQELFLQAIESNFTEGEFDIYQNFQRLSFEVICETAFGIKFSEHDEALMQLRKIFTVKKPPLMAILTVLIPELHAFFRGLFNISLKLQIDPATAVMDKVGRIIEARKSEKAAQRRDDLLQALLDAEARSVNVNLLEQTLNMKTEPTFSRSSSNSSGYDSEDTPPCTERGENAPTDPSDIKKPALTADEVKAQCYLFLLAGYETTSNILAFCAHSLAVHQDIQSKVYEEVLQVFGDGADADVTYTGVHQLHYMDMVVHEVLRMYPVVSPLLSRECTQTTVINGYCFPAGATVVPDVWSIHFDPDVWGPEDPNTFCPERFEPKRKQARNSMAFMAFGAGPKNCMGLRFAMLEIKSTLAEILLRYIIEPGEDVSADCTPPLLEGVTISPKYGIKVRLQHR